MVPRKDILCVHSFILRLSHFKPKIVQIHSCISCRCRVNPCRQLYSQRFNCLLILNMAADHIYCEEAHFACVQVPRGEEESISA